MNRTSSKMFTELIVWQRARAFAPCAYTQAEAFLKSEVYRLSSLLRRAAVSIPANFLILRTPLDKASRLLQRHRSAILTSSSQLL